MTRRLIPLALLALGACRHEVMETLEALRSPNGFEAQLIGYVEDCRVWDLGGDKAVLCGGGDSASTVTINGHVQSCGKGCTRRYTNTVTVERPDTTTPRPR